MFQDIAVIPMLALIPLLALPGLAGYGLKSDIEPFKGLLLGLFCITVGAGIDFGILFGDLAMVPGLTLGVMLIKGLVLSRLRNVGADQPDVIDEQGTVVTHHRQRLFAGRRNLDRIREGFRPSWAGWPPDSPLPANCGG